MDVLIVVEPLVGDVGDSEVTLPVGVIVETVVVVVVGVVVGVVVVVVVVVVVGVIKLEVVAVGTDDVGTRKRIPKMKQHAQHSIS